PPEREPEADGDGTQYDVEDVDVGAEPERELMPGLAVPGRLGYSFDVVRFNKFPKFLLIYYLDVMHRGRRSFRRETLCMRSGCAWEGESNARWLRAGGFGAASTERDGGAPGRGPEECLPSRSGESPELSRWS